MFHLHAFGSLAMSIFWLNLLCNFDKMLIFHYIYDYKKF